MSDCFVGQVMPTGFVLAPRGFAMCNGQLLPITQNQALFSLLGTRYGGDGIRTFQLPDLRGRTPVGSNGDYPVGTVVGNENVSLTTQTIPQHNHFGAGTTVAGAGRNPIDNFYGSVANEALYAPLASGPQVALNASVLSSTGGGQSHPNMQPYSVINFCIALAGIYPSRG